MTATTILAKYRVTQAQVDACHRIEDLNKHIVFYQVESATRPVEYKVSWNVAHNRLDCDPCPSEGGPCWHRRAAVAHAEITRLERIAECERQMIELAAEMAEEARAAAPYTIVEDETSSSLDGQRWEMRDGKNVPMR